MPGYRVVLVDFKAGAPPLDRLKGVFNTLKDWLRFSPDAWIVYSALSPQQIRDRFRAEFEDKANIVVLVTDLDHWSVYANETTRNWLRRDRTEEMAGD